MERQTIIDQYWGLEDKLKSLARECQIPLRRFLKDLPSLSEETVFKAAPLLRRQIELLHLMREWELDSYENVTLLPVSSLRS